MRGPPKLAVLLALLAVTGLCASTPAAPAQTTRTTFVALGSGVPGLLYEPRSAGPRSAVAVFVMHAEGDYLQMAACTELSKRGYRVLCANNSASKSGSPNDLSIDRILLDAKLGVAYLRTVPGVRKVVLLGHSGGGALLSAYQSIAENGPAVCQGPEKVLKCSSDLAGLPPADGLILLDANYGMSGMTLLSLNPAILDESTGKKIDPTLDLFNPQNGFDPKGSHYSEEFIHRFQSAVGQRENRLIAAALEQLRRIEAGEGPYSDDEQLVIPDANYLGFNNKLFAQDTRLLAHTQGAWPLIHKDGSVTTQVVQSVREPRNARSAAASYESGALKTSVRRFLTTYAIRVGEDFSYDADSIHGVDWLSSYTAPAGNVQSISVPLLTMGMTGSWEYLNAEIIYRHARSSDKSVAFVEGASHVFTACRACEQQPGQYGDTVKTTFDYVAQWLGRPGRF